MPEATIVRHGDSAAVVLPPALLESIGLQIGDVLNVTFGDRQLILRTVDDATRQRLIDEVSDDVFNRRDDVFRRLA